MARCLIAVLLLATACAEAGPPTLEAGILEASLPASIWPDDPDLVTELLCPDIDVDLIAQSITCTATLDVDAVTVAVEIDEEGAATAAIEEPLFVVASAADALVSRLREDLSVNAIEASCEGTVIVAEAGRSLGCIAISGGRSIAFDLVLDGEEGVWTLKLGEL